MLALFPGLSCDSLLRDDGGRVKFVCSKSWRATFCRLLEGLRVWVVAGGACEVEADRRGEEGPAERAVVL